MKWILSCFLTIFVFSVSAQSLVVRRPANLRQSPSTGSTSLRKLNPGDTLTLVEPEISSGFYHVSRGAFTGWVYQALVKKTNSVAVMALSLPMATPPANELVEVLDVGAGLCNLIKLPGNKYVVYDAGGDKLASGDRTLAQIKNYIPLGSEIELILSHTDADHIIAAGQVLLNYKVKKLLWGGYASSMAEGGNPTATYNRVLAALAQRPQTQNVNLHERDSIITPGNHFQIGNATFTFLCGFGKPLPDWPLITNSEKINSVSIIMKLDYANNSVLFCDDAVGRHIGDPEDALIATEEYVVHHASQYLKSTVIIAPHHGANNGSSLQFVQLTQPKW
ncbi:SH3 domain-containing protein [Mucilaginibacter sp.]|uniref:SH3 domain-containing protein n=1 Tax=Mucilaginibacter sp. TaxID=1882438 RepID=UPI00261DA193|nr:SH3 domain-containing protein [Mucilaginibacter sp.]MDB4927033.1 uncharacterized protein [Mucilaginibacter sp.]